MSFLAPLVSVLIAADARTSVPSLVMQAGAFAKLVLGSLLLMSIISWGIMWERIRSIRRVARADEGFLKSFRAGRGIGEARMLAAQHPESVLGRLATVGLEHLDYKGKEAAHLDSQIIELSARAMERTRVVEIERLEKNLSFLATTGSVAPFLGLMGTVWGIMTAFLNIGSQGSASLVVVAPGIAEALIATIAGLAAAIPAVIGYNFFVSRIRSLDNTAAAFVSEFSDGALKESRAEQERGTSDATQLRREVGV